MCEKCGHKKDPSSLAAAKICDTTLNDVSAGSSNPIICGICGAVFYTDKDFNAHTVSAHGFTGEQ